MGGSFPRAAAVGLALLSLAAAARLEAVREQVYPRPAVEVETLTITSGRLVRALSVAYTGLAADLYWLRAIQYYGGTKRRLVSGASPVLLPPPALAADPDAEYPLLYPLLDLATTLDPKFRMAYRFGAVFLAEGYPSGPGRPDLAVSLLEKGVRAQPDKWEYLEDIGFVHYWYRRDYQEAARWFDRAARVPGAPWWLRSLAATTFTQGGDRKSSRQIWTAIRQSADNDWLRQEADRRLLQLEALDDIDRINARIRQLAARTASMDVSWPALVRAGVVAGVPTDPAGVPYELSGAGTVRLSPRSPLWPPPEEPR